MHPSKKLVRVDTAEVKAQLVRKLGHQRADLYFHSLKKFLSLQLGKKEFDRICVTAPGKDNIKLHDFLVRSILSNAYTSAGTPPIRQTPTGDSQTRTVTIAAGFVVRWSVHRTGFDEPETDSETSCDSVKIAADSRFLYSGSS